MAGKLLSIVVLIVAISSNSVWAASDKRPTIITYDPSDFAPPTMVYQQIEGYCRSSMAASY